jgi:hypothetical protein
LCNAATTKVLNMTDLDNAPTIFPTSGAAHADTLPAGFMLGQYRVIKLLGRGGMGQVYLAENIQMHKKYALKVLPRAGACMSLQVTMGTHLTIWPCLAIMKRRMCGA